MASPPPLLPGVRFAPAERRARLLAAYDVDLVVDVGANSGQYASALRAAGYAGRIASFEPLTEPYRALADAAARDPGWDAWPVALGARAGVANVDVAEDSRNSSVLSVGERHLRSVPDSRMVAVESVRVTRLDDVWPHVAAELSLLPTYDSGPLFGDVLRFLGEHGFSPISFEGVLDDSQTGEMLQVDAIFARP
jgi:FkbM family methyltransferase